MFKRPIKKIFPAFCILSFAMTFRPAAAEDGRPPRHNPWELIIYRPENSAGMNDVRCWLRLQDEAGNDIPVDVRSYPNSVSATYEWISVPDVVNRYERSAYLSGGMAMHLHLRAGKYRISFYTPADRQTGAGVPNQTQWESNEFFYDTENPAGVIFVTPAADENGFYTGEWHIDYKAPKFFKFTKPERKKQDLPSDFPRN